MSALYTGIRFISITCLAVFCLVVFLFLAIALYEDYHSLARSAATLEISATPVTPFPVGVNYARKEIVEDPSFNWYVHEHLSLNPETLRTGRQIQKMLTLLERFPLLQQLASPTARTLIIYPGQRKEEVIASFGEILDWSPLERADFAAYIEETEPMLAEGKYYPGRYIVPRKAFPETVAPLLIERFTTEISSRYDETVAAQVPLDAALTIASLLEREAYDFTDMRIISGIIWNRLFIGMPLQLDASLQYVRGHAASAWWPLVVPEDKFLPSPYNTYENVGLPPAPIANPSLEAVLAALNPKPTTCLFYFHHTDGTFYCSDDYETHVEKLTALYGQGR